MGEGVEYTLGRLTMPARRKHSSDEGTPDTPLSRRLQHHSRNTIDPEAQKPARNSDDETNSQPKNRLRSDSRAKPRRDCGVALQAILTRHSNTSAMAAMNTGNRRIGALDMFPPGRRQRLFESSQLRTLPPD
ncbi:hypothetical protein M011DRAFT_462281 [Sporormia fimetaria CBS 119925]|uniref:Uncharacterized protein n=1 Tax=Sporormia fimetaria CBS 119925 TaxID=1340428 RepID=A0A6A6UYA3_9PLEO|nr:hypothetical protein M011DRAFT_462281 [Sporormia fimetaria CBS 119925]